MSDGFVVLAAVGRMPFGQSLSKKRAWRNARLRERQWRTEKEERRGGGKTRVGGVGSQGNRKVWGGIDGLRGQSCQEGAEECAWGTGRGPIKDRPHGGVGMVCK